MLCTAFGANAVAIKLTLTGIGVFTSAGIRFFIASIVIFLWARYTGRSLKLKKGQIFQVLIISAIFTLQLGSFYLGMSETPASRATLIVNLQPFFVLILAHYFIKGDRLTLRKITGMIMGFSGLAFLFLGRGDITTGISTWDLIILTATVLWACNAIYTKTIIHEFRPFQITFYPMLFSVPVFFLGGFIFDNAMIKIIDFRVISSMFYQALVTASLGFVAWNSLLQKHGAVALHSFVFIIPISGVALGGLLLGEAITSDVIIALLLIASGIITVHFHSINLSIFPFRRGGI